MVDLGEFRRESERATPGMLVAGGMFPIISEAEVIKGNDEEWTNTQPVKKKSGKCLRWKCQWCTQHSTSGALPTTTVVHLALASVIAATNPCIFCTSHQMLLFELNFYQYLFDCICAIRILLHDTNFAVRAVGVDLCARQAHDFRISRSCFAHCFSREGFCQPLDALRRERHALCFLISFRSRRSLRKPMS